MTACIGQSDWTTIAGALRGIRECVAARLTRYLSLRRQPPRMVPGAPIPPILHSSCELLGLGTRDSYLFPSKGNDPQRNRRRCVPRLPLLLPVSRLSTTCLLHLAPSKDQRPETRLIAKLETSKFSVFVFLPTANCLSALVPSTILLGCRSCLGRLARSCRPQA